MNVTFLHAPMMLLVSLVFAGCRSMPATANAAGADLPPAPSGIVVVRDYVDSQKIDGADKYFRIRYVWDYQQGVALYQRFAMDGAGELLESTPVPALTLEPTTAEMDYAYALVRQDPQLGPLVNRADAQFQGGFSVRDPDNSDCGPGSRCVRVIVAGGADGEVAIAHAIVDLASRRIVDRDA